MAGDQETLRSYWLSMVFRTPLLREESLIVQDGGMEG